MPICKYLLTLAAASVALWSCGERRGLDPRGPSEPPFVYAEPIPWGVPIEVSPGLMPRDALAVYPSSDGDAFYVSFKPQESDDLTAAEVLEQWVEPVFDAVGFKGGSSGVGLPAGTGSELPVADLEALAETTCPEVEQIRHEGFAAMCAVMRGEMESTDAIDRAFQNGEGMTFDQFKADIERQRIQYAFPQQHEGIPIEHVGVLASRWVGETVTKVHGSLINDYRISNERALNPEEAYRRGYEELRTIEGAFEVSRLDSRYRATIAAARQLPPRVDPVLLPYGSVTVDGEERAALRHAYRVLLLGAVAAARSNERIYEPASWMAWIDSETGEILQLLPQFDDVTAVGEQWAREPATATAVSRFEVDPAAGGSYRLQYSSGTIPLFTRLDRLGDDDFDDGEVSIADTSGGNTPFSADFGQPVSDEANAICAGGGNDTFRQVHAFSHLYRIWRQVVSAGTVPRYPEAAVRVWVDTDYAGNSSGYNTYGPGQSRLRFANGSGFADAGCPDATDQRLNGAQDATILAHEFAHLSNKRLHDLRPADWCGTTVCQVPFGRRLFHDFADAWAAAYTSSNCIGGWYRKNQGGAGVSVRCAANHGEDGALPRLTEVALPFSTTAVRDHFPEKRALFTGPYADGQIAGAALWEARAGMRSKCLPSGTAQFFVRLNRALWDFGFLTTSCSDGDCDRDVYRYLRDFMWQMVEQWSTAGQVGGPPAFHHNGAHTTNKVTSAFARAGVFMIPPACIDGDAATTEATFCDAGSGGENGGDAIIDIDDDDPADDPAILGVQHREGDYLDRYGGPPLFHVWTGPRYLFAADGSASGFVPSAATPSPCNTRFQVELATDAAFATNFTTSTPASGNWRTVSDETAPECYATWTPSSEEWSLLKGTVGETRIYYRVRTRDAADANEKISTRPANFVFNVPPAYAIVNDTGRP